MMKLWLSVSEIAKITGCTRQGISQRAKDKKENWPYRMVDGNGGPQKRFHIKDLPEDIQVAYAASLNLSFEALQNELKPVPKAEVKVAIDGYNCRSAANKTFKALSQCTETELDIARKLLPPMKPLNKPD